jgi:6-phosphogluconolactonase (cycloisomerase 2 family)
MKGLTRLASGLAVAAVAVAGLGATASADQTHAAFSPGFAAGGDHAVFVQTDNIAGNQIVSYERAENGALTFAHQYPTGGRGGILAGSAVDHLASQGSLTYDGEHALLYAVNAGSNTLSVFAVRGDQLRLREVLPSGGIFPVSVAAHGDDVYVLNALNGGAVSGYRVFLGLVFPIPGSTRQLGLDPNATPQFTNTPGQVAFSPDGTKLLVTTKQNGNDVDVFRVGFFGTLSAAPVVNPEPGAIPFGMTFDAVGHLVVTLTGPNALATFNLNGNGTISELSSVPTGQAATCWVAEARGRFYTSNAGSATLSTFQISTIGGLTLLGNTSTDLGTVDASASTTGQYLYVQAGGPGDVDAYRVNPDGSLTPVGVATVPGAAGGEGIVAF